MVGIDIGKNSFYVVGIDQRGAILLRQKCRVASWTHHCKHAAVPDHFGRKLQAQIRARNSPGRWDVTNKKEPTHVIESVSAPEIARRESYTQMIVSLPIGQEVRCLVRKCS